MPLDQKDRQALALAAQAYGADEGVLGAMAEFESSGDETVVNDWDSNAKAGTPSAGLLQFIQPTFTAFARQAKQANPRAWKNVKMEWMDPQAQALAAAWAIKNGKGSHWTTYERALASAGKAGKRPQKRIGLVADDHDHGSQAPMPQVGADGVASMFRKKKTPTSTWFADFLDDIDQQQIVNASKVQYEPVDLGDGPVSFSSKAKGGPGSSFKSIQSWADRLAGAKVQGDFQTTGGKHSRESLHYEGKAVDFGDANTSREQFAKLASYARAHPEHFKEFYYNPLGWGIRNGKIVKGLTVPGHDDHLHVGVV